MSQFVCINKLTLLESTRPHKVVLLCVCMCVCVCMFFLFVKRSTYNCRPLQKYEINTYVSTLYCAHLNAHIVKMAGGQVDSVESTWVKSTLGRRQSTSGCRPVLIRLIDAPTSTVDAPMSTLFQVDSCTLTEGLTLSPSSLTHPHAHTQSR